MNTNKTQKKSFVSMLITFINKEKEVKYGIGK